MYYYYREIQQCIMQNVMENEFAIKNIDWTR